MNSLFMAFLQLAIVGLATAFVLLMAFSEWTGRHSFLAAGFGAILSLCALFILLDAKGSKEKRRLAKQKGNS